MRPLQRYLGYLVDIWGQSKLSVAMWSCERLTWVPLLSRYPHCLSGSTLAAGAWATTAASVFDGRRMLPLPTRWKGDNTEEARIERKNCAFAYRVSTKLPESVCLVVPVLRLGFRHALRMQKGSSYPVLQLQARHTAEFRFVVGDQNQPLATRMGGDMQIIYAYGRAGAFQ